MLFVRAMVLSSLAVGSLQSIWPSSGRFVHHCAAMAHGSFELPLGSSVATPPLSGSILSQTKHVLLSTATPSTLVSNPIPPCLQLAPAGVFVPASFDPES